MQQDSSSSRLSILCLLLCADIKTLIFQEISCEQRDMHTLPIIHTLHLLGMGTVRNAVSLGTMAAEVSSEILTERWRLFS